MPGSSALDVRVTALDNTDDLRSTQVNLGLQKAQRADQLMASLAGLLPAVLVAGAFTINIVAWLMLLRSGSQT